MQTRSSSKTEASTFATFAKTNGYNFPTGGENRHSERKRNEKSWERNKHGKKEEEIANEFIRWWWFFLRAFFFFFFFYAFPYFHFHSYLIRQLISPSVEIFIKIHRNPRQRRHDMLFSSFGVQFGELQKWK